MAITNRHTTPLSTAAVRLYGAGCGCDLALAASEDGAPCAGPAASLQKQLRHAGYTVPRTRRGHPRAARGRAKPAGKRDETLRFLLGVFAPRLRRQAARCCLLERVQAQGLHEAGAAGAGAERGHGGERVAHDDAQAELALAACSDARDPRGVRAQPPPVGEAGVRGTGRPWRAVGCPS